MLEPLVIEAGGKVTIPVDLRHRYGFEPNTPVRVIEMQSGILLVPLTDAPMSEGLKAELAAWQSLGADALEMFPFEGEGVSEHRRPVLGRVPCSGRTRSGRTPPSYHCPNAFHPAYRFARSSHLSA
jgi:bifunctional DNA-binding transcriptional regulator/antitoxin component of YhaV-PrlF toxin-antitoxin module